MGVAIQPLEPYTTLADELPKPLFHWTEPADWPKYRAEFVQQTPTPKRALDLLWFFIRCLALIILPWLAFRLADIPTAATAPYLGLCVAVALFFTSIRWLYRSNPVHSTQISFRPNGFTQHFGKQIWDQTYRALQSWKIIEIDRPEHPLRILLLQSTHSVQAIALPDASTAHALAQLLSDKKVPHNTSLHPPWTTAPN